MEFKREAVRLALTSGRPRDEIAEDHWGRVVIADKLGRSISR